VAPGSARSCDQSARRQGARHTDRPAIRRRATHEDPHPGASPAPRVGGGEASKFNPHESDALTTVFRVARRPAAGERLTDTNGHHYVFRQGDGAPAVEELRLTVPDVGESARF
jgi:hypothetical protein